MKTTKQPPIRKPIIIFSFATLVVALGFFAWTQHHQNSSNKEIASQTIITTTDHRLTGTISSLPIPEWGIKLNFKDADKVTYKILDPAGNSLELYVKDTYLPDGVCGRIGVAIQKSKNSDNASQSTQIGNSYYNKVGAPGYCENGKSQDKQSTNFKQNLVTEAFGNNFTIIAL